MSFGHFQTHGECALASVAMSFLDSGCWQANKHVFALVCGATLSSAGQRERIQGLPPWQESPVWLGLLRRVDARRKTGAHAWLQDWPGLLSDECIRGRGWPLLGPARLQPLRWRRPPSVWSRPGTPRMAITCTPAVYCIQLPTRPRRVPRTTT